MFFIRIYPSKHKIKAIPQSKIDTDLNVPLAYIDIDFTKYKIEKIIDSKFSTDKKHILIPNEELKSDKIKIFNKFEEEIDIQDKVIKNEDKFIYYPSNMVKFSPKSFLWKATLKKKMFYSISDTYNININCKYSDNLNNLFINAFMNPGERDDLLVYNNVKINNNSTVYNTFKDTTDEKADFTFIKTHNCKHIDINNTQEIDIPYYLNLHTNLWLGCEDAVALNTDYKMLTSSNATTFKITNPIVSNNAQITTSYYFDLTTITPPTGVTIHNIFSSTLVPALILEYINAGFVIITSFEILDDPLKYESFIYELMLYVYLNTYVSTDYIRDWITYKIPDYEIINNSFSTKSSFTSKSNINNLLGLKGNAELVKIDIIDDVESTVRILDTKEDLSSTTGAIKCIGTTNGNPVFVLDGILDGYNEPEKPVNWYSVYSDGYVYYLEDLHYLLETNITNKISLAEQNNNLIIKIYNFKSSNYCINKKKDTTITIPFIKSSNEKIERVREAEYSIYYIDNKIAYCYREDYIESDDKILLFDILVTQTDDAIEIYDMRQLGGGLSEDEEDNYELLDIGHMNGRPYRIGGALVLTMPTKYKPYEDLIQKAIDKYKVAEDYIAIIFKDEEDEI